MITDIIIRPRESERFNVGEIRAALAANPLAALDPVTGARYIMADRIEDLEAALENRRRPNTQFFCLWPVIVGVAAHRIVIWYRAPCVVQVRAFIAWLRARYELEFLDEESNDITAQVDTQLEFLFGPAAQS